MNRYAAALFAICGLFLLDVGATRAAGPETLKGQVVCSECWFEADRKTTPYGGDADVKCAIRCDKGGTPMALAVVDASGDAALYVLEDGAFARGARPWTDWVTQSVEVTGTTRVEGDKRFMKVDALTVARAAAPAAPSVPAAADAAPELALKDLAGAEQRLSALKGRVVVVNFWATWCVPCRREMPGFVALHDEMAAAGVSVVGVSADLPDTQGAIPKFVRDTKITFPVWVGATVDDMARFGLSDALPSTVIIDRQGNVVERVTGMIKEEDLRAKVKAVLGK
jgi:thiol-disulfide isomerase/thioredoxin